MSEYQSANVEKLAEALCKAQSVMQGARKDSSNPFFKSSYADLESIWNACRGPLTDNGLCITQTMDYREDKMILVTTLMHASGQWIRSFAPISSAKTDPQSIGSAISYYRRYTLAALTGVYQTDDDAERAMDSYRNEEEPKLGLTDFQKSQLQSFSKNDTEGTQRICAQFKIKSIWEVPADQVVGVINWFNVRKKEKENGSARVA